MPALQVLVLSPHRDDAAFSCGLLMANLARAGAEITVVNVCTRSDYAPYLAVDDPETIETISAARALEDTRFAEELAAISSVADAVRWIDMQWLDAPLRLSIETEQVLVQNSAVHAEVAELAAAMRTLPVTDVVLVPLAMGGHIDHLLVREAAQEVFAGRNVFYEDLPYACRMTSEQRSEVMQAVSGLKGWSAPSTAEAGSKRRMAMCYPSQIAPEVADEMESYVGALGGRERFYSEDGALQLMQQALQSGQA